MSLETQSLFRSLMVEALNFRREHGNSYVCPCCDWANDTHVPGCPWPVVEAEMAPFMKADEETP